MWCGSSSCARRRRGGTRLRAVLGDAVLAWCRGSSPRGVTPSSTMVPARHAQRPPTPPPLPSSSSRSPAPRISGASHHLLMGAALCDLLSARHRHGTHPPLLQCGDVPRARPCPPSPWCRPASSPAPAHRGGCGACWGATPCGACSARRTSWRAPSTCSAGAALLHRHGDGCRRARGAWSTRHGSAVVCWWYRRATWSWCSTGWRDAARLVTVPRVVPALGHVTRCWFRRGRGRGGRTWCGGGRAQCGAGLRWRGSGGATQHGGVPGGVPVFFNTARWRWCHAE